MSDNEKKMSKSFIKKYSKKSEAIENIIYMCCDYCQYFCKKKTNVNTSTSYSIKNIKPQWCCYIIY